MSRCVSDSLSLTTHLPFHGWGQAVGSTQLVLCSLRQSGRHHVLQQSVVSSDTIKRTPHWESVVRTTGPALVLRLLLLDGSHGTPQDIQLSWGRGPGEGIVDGHPYFQLQSFEFSQQLVFILRGRAVTEEQLLLDDQPPADLLQLLILLHLTVQLILCTRQTRGLLYEFNISRISFSYSAELNLTVRLSGHMTLVINSLSYSNSGFPPISQWVSNC